MQQSAQRNSAKAIGVGFPGFRKLEDLPGNKVRDGVDSVLELKRLARHPMGRAHSFHDLRLKTVYQAARTPKVTHWHSPPRCLPFIPWFCLDLVAHSPHFPGPRGWPELKGLMLEDGK
jgi:hypothetical protein